MTSTSKLFDLTGKVAAVFGGSSGIGRSIAWGLAEAGAEVVPISRDRAKLEGVTREMAAAGRDLTGVQADVSVRADVERALREVLDKHGKVDILVNSAGAHHKKPTLEVTDAEWDAILTANLKGVFISCQVFGRQMIHQRDGRIINIASLGAHVALSEATAYAASKAGVRALTRCLAVEWADFNVRVNSITPGVFRTPLNERALSDPARLERILNRTPFHRLGRTDELIGAAVYLASDASAFVTGTDIAVDGGYLAWGM